MSQIINTKNIPKITTNYIVKVSQNTYDMTKNVTSNTSKI